MKLAKMSPSASSTQTSRYSVIGRGLLLLPVLLLAACGTGTVTASLPSGSSLQTYLGPAVSSNLAKTTFAIDRTAKTFVQYQYLANSGNEQYIANSGVLSTLTNGILNVGLTYAGGNGTQGTIYSPPQAGSWAVEWPGQVGLVGLLGQPVMPIVPNQSCPDLATAVSYRFVTLPNAGDSTGAAYGSASIATTGSTVNFTNISQLNIAGGAATNPSSASVAATCSPTFYGDTISAPNFSTVTNPGNGQTTTPSATIAIGSSGFLVEDNGYTPNPFSYQNILGAGTGAIGLPAPATALSTSALTGAQYTGFIYGTGAAGNTIKNLANVPASTRISSFGYPSGSSACAAPPVSSSSTVLYGGEYAANNPAANAYGNCDVAVDFGAQDAKNNGLYPTATVYLSANFPGNTTGKTYSFAAVAIAAQIQGKYAIFLIGLDRTGLQIVSQGQQSQDWGIYLLQSN